MGSSVEEVVMPLRYLLIGFLIVWKRYLGADNIMFLTIYLDNIRSDQFWLDPFRLEQSI
jgi:hypothetical protein